MLDTRSPSGCPFLWPKHFGDADILSWCASQTPSWADWQKKFNDKEKDDKRQFAGVFKQNVEKRRDNIMKLLGEATANL